MKSPRVSLRVVTSWCGLVAALVPAFAAPVAPPPTTRAVQAELTPAAALERLTAGNARFVAGQPLARDWARERSATADGQYPFAVVLSCLDSRASSEIIFDQGLGEIFNARVAGNIVNDDILGSMEFACQAAGAKLIVVVGHSACGAVKGAAAGVKLGNLTGLLERIQPAVAAARAKQPSLAPTDGAFVESATELNVREAMRQIRERSPVLRELLDAGKIRLVGGIHDLATGRVRFLAD